MLILFKHQIWKSNSLKTEEVTCETPLFPLFPHYKNILEKGAPVPLDIDDCILS